MSNVLVVQPDAAQAETLRGIFARIGAELVIVASTSDAVDAVSQHIPDLILLSTLLAPRDEDTLLSHLRTLEGASHLQTLTIPQFRKKGKSEEKSKGGLFRKKTKAPIEVGCDPSVFAEEVVAQLRLAEEIRSRPVMSKPIMMATSYEESSAIEPAPAEPVWKAQAWPETASDREPAYEPAPIAEPEPIVDPEPIAAAEAIVEPEFSVLTPAEDEIDRLARELGLNLKVVEIEDDALRPKPVPVAEEEEFDFAAALDRARIEADRRNTDVVGVDADAAEAIREAAIAQARAAAEREAREALAADLARVQAEAEAMRDMAIAEARAVAEREAREKLDAELARVRAETEVTVAGALNAEREAREKLDAELARVRAETEVTVADALNKVKQEAKDAQRLRAEAEVAKTEAERARAEAAEVAARLRAQADEESARARAEVERARAEATEVAQRLRTQASEEAARARAEAERLRAEAQEALAAELAKVRAEVEQSLAAQLDAARTEAERMRAAEAKAARDRAAAEAQLKSEIDRLKFVAAQTRRSDESEVKRAAEQIKQLESELAKVHAKTEQRQAAQLEDLRSQMAEMREAAAQHARAAATEAVKSEVARVAAVSGDAPRRLNVVRMQPRSAQQPVLMPIAESIRDEEPDPAPVVSAPVFTLAAVSAPAAAAEPVVAEAPAAEEHGRDYYSLWRSKSKSSAPPPPRQGTGEQRHIDFKRHARWALPVAACLLLVTNTGTAISTVARLMKPAEKSALTVQPLDIEKPFIQVVEERVGQAKVESTPEGAEVVVDGRSYGPTPVTVPDLEVGPHTLVLKSSTGAISRQFTVKANQTTMLTEAIFSGWLAIFAPFPVTVLIDGQAVSLTDDGRVMTTPGKHVVELVAERFNYRSTDTLDVRPGETTAHTLVAPMGTVRVTAPEGTEIKIDGQPAVGSAAEGFAVEIGSHDITATHPQLGERRVSVDVRHGSLTEVTMSFE